MSSKARPYSHQQRVRILGINLIVFGALATLFGWGAADIKNDTLQGIWAYYAFSADQRESYYMLSLIFISMGIVCLFPKKRTSL